MNQNLEYPMRHHWSTIAVLVILAIIFTIGFLTSCANQTPMLGNKTSPFIVDEIEQTSIPGFAKYLSTSSRGMEFNNFFILSNRAAIDLPVGAYNIGDTIK
jgi:hypothetical protein